MRKVAVQVQDIGVQLCWHTFVDDAAADLGVAEAGAHRPAARAVRPRPAGPARDPAGQDPGRHDQHSVRRRRHRRHRQRLHRRNRDRGRHLRQHRAHRRGLPPARELHQSRLHALAGRPGSPRQRRPPVRARPSAAETGRARPHSRSTSTTSPGTAPTPSTSRRRCRGADQKLRDDVATEYGKRLADYNAEKARRFREAFYNAARERIKLASGVAPRRAEALREEERIVVYRRLIAQLMDVGTATPATSPRSSSAPSSTSTRCSTS